ncbi:GNAT family N-acetyltransferase [Phytomonospora sp. NPDC050363]|uniref:GNAT family N-acetyltransferase n=1 Tax=Phytomonospora sp. NPDC050363 TaxID=3155642 RepID=UPI0033FC59F6
MADVVVTDAADERRFEARVDGELAGFLDYARDDERIALVHTEVDPAFEGKGIGSALARFSLDTARADTIRVLALCPFVVRWVQKHPEYAGIVDYARTRD